MKLLPIFPLHSTSVSKGLSPFSSVTQSCLILCDPMDCSMPGFPVHHQLLELAQTHVHRVSDAIQLHILCCPLLLPSIFPILDSILKNRDITLPTKVRLVKAMVFPVVMYGYKSWTVKKAEELMLLNCGVGEDS